MLRAQHVKTLGPAVQTAINPILQRTPTSEAARTALRLRLSPWRQWYHTERWRRLRWQVLTRDLFTCAMCGKGPQHDTSKLVCDHKEPHRGSEMLFWDEQNLQCLCADPCHNSRKQAEEQAHW